MSGNNRPFSFRENDNDDNSGENRQINSDIYIVNEENEIDDDIERERRGDNFYDEDEKIAEEEGEDLFVNEDEFIAGQTDARKEGEIFEHLGLNVDNFEEDYIDDEGVYTPLSQKHRRAIENLMEYRDYKKPPFHTQNSSKHQIHRGYIVDDALKDFLDMDDDEDRMKEIEERVQRRRKFQQTSTTSEKPDISSFESAQIALRLEPKDNALDERLQKAIDVCFRYFLHIFDISLIDETVEENSPHYLIKMKKMILDESAILYVSATHLFRFGCENLLKWIEDQPSTVLNVMNDTLAMEINQINRELYMKIYKYISFKTILTDWPYSTTLRNLRSSDLNSLIRVTGVINKRGNVLPKLKVMYLICSTCKMTLNENPVYFDKVENAKFPKNCINCGGSSFVVNRLRTIYSDVQRLTLQESPGSVPAGLSARQKEILIGGELVDKVKPGDEVDVLGIYKTKYDTGLNIKVGFPVLATEIEVNNIIRKEDVRIDEMTDEDITAIHDLSRDPNIRERIIASIAPSIWGHRDLKTALAYSMFGGVRKGANSNNKNDINFDQIMQFSKQTKTGVHTIRGDINVLLLGDPGLGKSQALQYVHKTFPRTILTTGKGASAAGLTAGLKRDNKTGEWTLEGGALVLADEGICLVDEFDKMTEKDRVSIHEAMEQQTISISKANINTALKARCAVIAAANPRHGGRYEPSYTFKENVDLSDPILSRFDLIIVMRDMPNVDQDYYLSQYVVTNHQLNHPDILNLHNFEERISQLEENLNSTQAYQPIDQDLFKKYIIYARSNCSPNLDTLLSQTNITKLSSFYSKLRIKAANAGGFPLTLRHMESIIRISEANAKMRLSNKVESNDLDYAIATMLDSFISSQKYSVVNTLSREFARYRALAKGGYHMLVEIVRQCMQKHIQWIALKDDIQQQQKFKITNKNENNNEINRNSHKIDFNIFLQQAIQNKFTRYQIDNWIQSEMFKSLYFIETVEGTSYIHCKPLNSVPVK